MRKRRKQQIDTQAAIDTIAPVRPRTAPIPCSEHRWVDITNLGDRQPRYMCGWCGERRTGEP